MFLGLAALPVARMTVGTEYGLYGAAGFLILIGASFFFALDTFKVSWNVISGKRNALGLSASNNASLADASASR